MARAFSQALVLCTSFVLANAGCSNSRWRDAYSQEMCREEGDAAIVQCLAKSGGQCGMRMESNFKVGMGRHDMGVKAAPGAGVATTYYLSNNGGMYDKSCTHAWVELDFEIMGNQVGPQSKIWTNMFTGTCQEHWKFITVPFDVSADYHTYSFDITDDSVSWLVDGIAYRTEAIAHHKDVQASAQSSAFGEFCLCVGQELARCWRGHHAVSERSRQARLQHQLLPSARRVQEGSSLDRCGGPRNLSSSGRVCGLCEWTGRLAGMSRQQVLLGRYDMLREERQLRSVQADLHAGDPRGRRSRIQNAVELPEALIAGT